MFLACLPWLCLRPHSVCLPCPLSVLSSSAILLAQILSGSFHRAHSLSWRFHWIFSDANCRWHISWACLHCNEDQRKDSKGELPDTDKDNSGCPMILSNFLNFLFLSFIKWENWTKVSFLIQILWFHTGTFGVNRDTTVPRVTASKSFKHYHNIMPT